MAEQNSPPADATALPERAASRHATGWKLPPRRPGTFEITDLPQFWVMSGFGETEGTWQRCYFALCRAYGVPVDWAQDQFRRRDATEGWSKDGLPPVPLMYNTQYPRDRARFAAAVDGYWVERSPGCPGPFADMINRGFWSTYNAAEEVIRELDAIFFSEVYGCDLETAVTEEDLVSRFGFPTKPERDAALEERIKAAREAI